MQKKATVMKRFVDAASRARKNADDKPEVDRIPGTTKIRTYVSECSRFFSEEGTIENIVKAVELCKNEDTKP